MDWRIRILHHALGITNRQLFCVRIAILLAVWLLLAVQRGLVKLLRYATLVLGDVKANWTVQESGTNTHQRKDVLGKWTSIFLSYRKHVNECTLYRHATPLNFVCA